MTKKNRHTQSSQRDITSQINFLKLQIKHEGKMLRLQLYLGLFVFISGVVIIIAAYWPGELIVRSEGTKWMLTLGGTFISSIASFPLRDISNRKDKIAALHFLCQEFEATLAVETSIDTAYIEELRQRFWQLFDKLAGG